MDPVWTQLPEVLADMVCNKLTQVRRIPDNMKNEIVSQRFLFAKLMNEYLARNNYDQCVAYEMFRNDIGGLPSVVWQHMTPEERWDFYHAFGPHYTDVLNDYIADMHEAWDGWVDESRDF